MTIDGMSETRRGAPTVARGHTGLQIAATIGAVLALFEAYVVLKWVLGPGFTPVHVGPTPVPPWIKVGAIGFQALFVVIAVVLIVRLSFATVMGPLVGQRVGTTCLAQGA